MPADFTKVRMIQDDDYEETRNHTCPKCEYKCNEDIFERNDELNNKYLDTMSRVENSADVSNTEVEHNNAEAAHESNAGVQDTVETHNEGSSFVKDAQEASNNVESAISNPPDANVPLNQASNMNNVVVAENDTQVSPELAQSAVNVTPLTPPPVSSNRVQQVYNCTPNGATTSPGKPVLPTKSKSKIQPYKCPFCPNTYSTQYGVKRHAKQKHPDSVTPLVSQPTEHPIPAGHPYVKLIELDGYPAATEESPPLSDKQEDLPPLPPDNDVPPVNDVILTTSQSPKRGKKKPKKKSNKRYEEKTNIFD